MTEPTEPSGPDSFWQPAPQLPPQAEYRLPPDPTMSVPRIELPPMPVTRDYARWEWRVAASVIDAALLLPWLVLVRTGEQTITPGSPTGGPGRVLVYVGSAGFLAFLMWNSVIRQGHQGASLGKSWVGLRVIEEESGHEMGVPRSFARTLLHIVNAIPFALGYLWPLWDKKSQTFSDKITHTVVVYVRRR
ncbi:MAG: hypothetical protein JWQ32_2607 [Marmoricola sp.]|nr:hypothetical protein [Marmoricola sp.]